MQTIEKTQNILVASIEHIAYKLGYISLKKLHKLASNYNNEYGKYLLRIRSSKNEK